MRLGIALRPSIMSQRPASNLDPRMVEACTLIYVSCWLAGCVAGGESLLGRSRESFR